MILGPRKERKKENKKTKRKKTKTSRCLNRRNIWTIANYCSPCCLFCSRASLQQAESAFANDIGWIFFCPPTKQGENHDIDHMCAVLLAGGRASNLAGERKRVAVCQQLVPSCESTRTVNLVATTSTKFSPSKSFYVGGTGMAVFIRQGTILQIQYFP